MRPLVVFGGHCRGCGHGTAAQPDRQMVFQSSESEAETRIPPDAIEGTLVGDGLTLAKAARSRKLSEVQSLVCNACGTINDKRRVYRKAYYRYSIGFGLWVGLSVLLRNIARGIDSLPILVMTGMVVAAATALFVGVCAIVQHLRNPWICPESCNHCSGGPLLPAVTMIGRKLPCPNCVEQTFRYRDTGRSTGQIGGTS